jgi:hypothetical protein
MIEEEEPAVESAEEVGAVEDSGVAQAEAGTWALPEHGAITTCPKCHAAGDDASTILHVTYHYGQRARDLRDSFEEQARQSPCSIVMSECFPTHDPATGLGGEHLCVKCQRCRFGWVEKVANAELPYWRPAEEEEE